MRPSKSTSSSNAPCRTCSELTAKEAAEQLAEQLGADVVQTIGNRFVIYRRSKRDDVEEHIRLWCANNPSRCHGVRA